MKKIVLASLLTMSFWSLASHAEDKGKMKTGKMPKMEWTAMQRENMAKMHESMATCLRSNKAVGDCRAEMKTSCSDMGKDCPMMHEKGDRMMYEE